MLPIITEDLEGGGGEEVHNPNSRISKAGHPLLNSVVASTLFEMVSLTQLRTLRLVCKDWHSISLPIWRRTVQINIHAHQQSCNYNQLPWRSTSGIQQDATEEKPFRNVRLHRSHFLPPISRPYFRPFTSPITTDLNPVDFGGRYVTMEYFWSNYGHWLHKLELKDVHVVDVEAFKRAIFEQTPNLQELILDCVNDVLPFQAPDEDEGEGPTQPNLNLKAFALKKAQLPFGWRLLFTRFPNIQKLELCEPSSATEEFIECLENMLGNPARRSNLPITDLRLECFHFTMTSVAEGLLAIPLLKLKVLHLSLFQIEDDDDDDGFDFSVLQMAKQLRGHTLKELHLSNEVKPVDFWESVSGVNESLTELQMKGYALAFDLHFLLKFPNLRVLRVEQHCGDQLLRGTKWSSLERMPHLREFYFTVTRARDVLSERILNEFARIMPNLESLTGQLTNNQTLRVVCRNWRKLKKLVILCGKCFDRVHRTCPPLKGGMMDIDDVGITGIVPGSDERVPCIADLQELCHLTLEHVTFIGSASVFDGFMKLPHLSSLDICDINLIWDGLDALRQHLQGGLTISPMCL